MLDSRVSSVHPPGRYIQGWDEGQTLRNKVLPMALSQSFIWMPLSLKSILGSDLITEIPCVCLIVTKTPPSTYLNMNIGNSREHGKSVGFSGSGQTGSWGGAEGHLVFRDSFHLPCICPRVGRIWGLWNSGSQLFRLNELPFLSPPRILHAHGSSLGL